MGRVVHFEIHADDCDRAERFYSRVFGWTVQRNEDAPVDYRLLTTGEDGEPGINGAIVARSGKVSGKDAVVAFVCTVEVDDIDATEKAVAEAGGEQVVDRQTMDDVGAFSYFKDPEGNVFGAMQPA
jgi:predicted enzyme related to lactoylglutathione lyase